MLEMKISCPTLENGVMLELLFSGVAAGLLQVLSKLYQEY